MVVELLLQNADDPLDIIHLIDLFRLKLHSELLLEGENQIQVMNGVPGFNILRGRLWRDLVRADRTHSGQAT